LDRELRLVKAKVVVLAGATSFKANVGSYSTIDSSYRPSSSIQLRAGCVEHKDGRWWIGTINPAFVMRQPEWRIGAVDHLKKAHALAEGLEPQRPVVEIYPSDQRVKEYCEEAIEYGYFSHDVETVPPPEKGTADWEEDEYVGETDWTVTMCGFSARPYHAILVRPSQIQLFKPAFKHSGLWALAHNQEYDYYYEAPFVGEVGAKKFDTLLATHYLRSSFPKKLKPYCLQQYTYLPYYNRDLGRLNEPLYCGMDVITTLLAGRQQMKELVAEGLWEVFFKYGMPLLPILEDMRHIGVQIDIRKAFLFKRIIEHKIARAEVIVGRMMGPLFNWASSKQRKELFYDKWGLPTQFNGMGREKRVTTDYEARKRLRWWIEADPQRMIKHKAAHVLLNLMDYLSGERKKLEYLGRIEPDGRIHVYYKAYGTESFRLSSVPNMQNWPIYSIKDWGGARRDTKGSDDPISTAGSGQENNRETDPGSLRSLVVPDKKDHVLLTLDFSQMQLWIYAAQFNVKWLLDIKASGDYIYGVVGEALYKEPFFDGKGKAKANKIKGYSEQRMRRIKAVPLGFLFGRTSEAVAKEYGWPTSEAEEMRKWWFGKCPELLRSYDTIKYKLGQQDYIKHVFGQKVWFPSKKLTEAINSHAQSNEAFILIGSIIPIYNEFKARGWWPSRARLMLTTHDSMTFSIEQGLVVEAYEEIIAPVCNRPIPELGGITLEHEAEVSLEWDWNTTPYRVWKEQQSGQAVLGGTGQGSSKSA